MTHVYMYAHSNILVVSAKYVDSASKVAESVGSCIETESETMQNLLLIRKTRTFVRGGSLPVLLLSS